MRQSKQKTITRDAVQRVLNNGYTSIYSAYAKPSYNKVRAFNWWRDWCNNNGYRAPVIYGFNCNYFTLYAISNDGATFIKITYANTYTYKII